PARFPMEFTAAIPAAAALPRKNEVGSDQKSGAQVSTPAAARERNVIAIAVLFAVTAATTKPTAPQSAGITKCQRRSRCLSALRPHRIMATTATRNGIALRRPVVKLPFTPVAFTSVGIQNVRPYWPITKQK